MNTADDTQTSSDVQLEQVKDKINKASGTFVSVVRVREKSGGSRRMVEFDCQKGHRLVRRFSDVHRICQHCRSYTLTEAHEIALKNKGKFLSDSYVKSTTKYTWECQVGHKFEMTYTGVQKGHWCNICSQGKRESICRAIFEFIYGHSFPTIRPKWLPSPHSTANLELDGYCEPLKIAFEHHGLQHYEHNKFYHPTESEFIKAQQRDEMTVAGCEKHGVDLVIVPYSIPTDSLYKYILNKAPRVPSYTPIALDYTTLTVQGKGSKKLLEIQEYLHKNFVGYKLFATAYEHNKALLKLCCNEGHNFEMSWKNISRLAILCTACHDRQNPLKQTALREIKLFCEKHNLTLDSEYKNCTTKYEWICNICFKGKVGSWCSVRKFAVPICCTNPKQ